MKKILFFVTFFALTSSDKAQIVIDFDGNTYNTVTLGTQVWMAENLKTTHYADGSLIPKITGDASWHALTSTSQAYCWYNDDSVTYASMYGALYTWAAAMKGAASSFENPSRIQGACPTGWHLPSDDEWTAMENYLIANGYNYNGTTTGNFIAKSLADTTHWFSSTNAGAVGNTDYPSYRNKTGFTALPGGYRSGNGMSFNNTIYGSWWSATTETGALHRSMRYEYSNVFRGADSQQSGYSVRCVMDNHTPINYSKYSDAMICYPNPASEKLYINNIITSKCFIVIFDLNGKQVLSEQISSKPIDISKLIKGIYIVKLLDSKNATINKLIKE